MMPELPFGYAQYTRRGNTLRAVDVWGSPTHGQEGQPCSPGFPFWVIRPAPPCLAARPLHFLVVHPTPHHTHKPSQPSQLSPVHHHQRLRKWPAPPLQQAQRDKHAAPAQAAQPRPSRCRVRAVGADAQHGCSRMRWCRCDGWVCNELWAAMLVTDGRWPHACAKPLGQPRPQSMPSRSFPKPWPPSAVVFTCGGSLKRVPRPWGRQLRAADAQLVACNKAGDMC